MRKLGAACHLWRPSSRTTTNGLQVRSPGLPVSRAVQPQGAIIHEVERKQTGGVDIFKCRWRRTWQSDERSAREATLNPREGRAPTQGPSKTKTCGGNVKFLPVCLSSWCVCLYGGVSSCLPWVSWPGLCLPGGAVPTSPVSLFPFCVFCDGLGHPTREAPASLSVPREHRFPAFQVSQ